LVMNRSQVEREIQRQGALVIQTVYQKVEDAVVEAIRITGAEISFSVREHNKRSDSTVSILILTHNPHDQFVFWKAVSDPSLERPLIVPQYHPIIKGGQYRYSVTDQNGLSQGNAILNVYPPHDAVAHHTGRVDWTHINHPYRAVGRDLEMTIDGIQIRTTDGVRELAQFLIDALGLGKYYVAVIGGFHPPLQHPSNRIERLGIAFPSGKPDGRESSFVWQYRVLSDEGELTRAYVPSRFIDEGWLTIYEGAEFLHGTF
jgi:hypothetical protein